jgi:hypothetical protein
MASDLVVDDLDTIAQRIQTACEEFKNSMRTALRAALDAGDGLMATKARVPGGIWQRWLLDHCCLSVRTAQLYVQLAEHRGEIESELGRVANLSLRAARRLIMQPAPANKPDTESNDADAPSGVSQLLPSWQTASKTQRSEFLVAIGVTALLAAMPVGMRDELEQRGLGSLELRARTKHARAVIKKLRKPPTTTTTTTIIEGTAIEILAP